MGFWINYDSDGSRHSAIKIQPVLQNKAFCEILNPIFWKQNQPKKVQKPGRLRVWFCVDLAQKAAQKLRDTPSLPPGLVCLRRVAICDTQKVQAIKSTHSK
jgi:hypothetical protein